MKFWKSDRWGRSAADVLATVNELRDRGVHVVSLTENFDLATKEGRLMFGVLALAAEYELELRAERQADGIAAARRRQAEGRMLPGKKHIGRPPATGPAELAALRDLIAGGKSVTQAARILKIGRRRRVRSLGHRHRAHPAQAAARAHHRPGVPRRPACPASGRRAPADKDTCPATGRGRLSYPRAEYLFKQASKQIDPHKKGWTLHQLRHSALQHLAAGGRTAPELQAKSRHQHLASLSRYVRLGEQTSARVTAEADPAARRRPR